MHLPHPSLPRDPIVLLAWLATRCGLALMAPLSRLLEAVAPMPQAAIAWGLREGGAAVELHRIGRVVERGLAASERIGALHAEAADAIESAEEQFEEMRAVCAGVMALPARGTVRDVLPETEFEFLPVAA